MAKNHIDILLGPVSQTVYRLSPDRLAGVVFKISSKKNNILL